MKMHRRNKELKKWMKQMNKPLPKIGHKAQKQCVKSKKIYQLRIDLVNEKPPIWRRVLVGDEMTFEELHFVIQKVFGWENKRPYIFQVGRKTLASSKYAKDHAKDYPLSACLNDVKQFRYHYEWQAASACVIKVEKVMDPKDSEVALDELPKCIRIVKPIPDLLLEGDHSVAEPDLDTLNQELSKLC